MVRDTALYAAVRRLSNDSKRVWVASPYLGRGARNVFSPSLMTATDRRLLVDIKSGYVDKTELAAFRTWAPDSTRTLRRLHAKLYVFDKGAIITSANLSRNAFERNREVGVVFTDGDMAIVTNAFVALYKGGKTISAAQVKALPKRKISLAERGAGNEGSGKHTSIDIWEAMARDPDQAATESRTQPPDGAAGPTCECDDWIPKLARERIGAELKKRKLRRVQIFSSGDGLKATRKAYRTGALFDVSDHVGTKKANWTVGARRDLGIVKAVFGVPGHSVVVYRTAAAYRVDGVLLRAAKALHVYSGHPKFDELVDYRQRIANRKKAIARKNVR
ncbi:MAG: phospholipase D-like domain-containing protein [Acidiferrobacteraceae bacterium]